MVYGGYSYIDEKYKPSKNDFVTLLWVKGEGKLEVLAEMVGAESSVGTWTSISTMNDFVWERLRARVFDLKKVKENAGFIKVAYPLEHFDHDNLPQLLASIRGNIYGIKEIKELKLLDWSIPEKYQKFFKGPLYGIKGIRKMIGTTKSKRPHVGTIIKPKVGLSPSEFADASFKALSNGLDLVKDDENLVNQAFCLWEERASKTISKIESIGEPKIYVPNITDFIPKMMERIEFLDNIGWKMCMIDVYMLGIPTTKLIVDELHKRKFMVHAHRAGHGAETRGSRGVGFNFWLKIFRLLGVDQIHTGTGVGKMEGSPITTRNFGQVASQQKVKGFEPVFLESKWAKHIKPVMPVASGGLHPGMVGAVCEVYGTTDVTLQAGGGVHGHPQGTEGGAKAMRNASERAAKGGVKVGAELQQAFDKWGFIDPVDIKKQFSALRKNRGNLQKEMYKQGLSAVERFEGE
ncbi:MAG: ribulose-bisphosphate carboxylase large subunit [Candidatus Altiarchaeota archaeon]|nr:ribulose-bisphosphate carboxylase large subunit [Candidatus Altiarchaeota archaeon]